MRYNQKKQNVCIERLPDGKQSKLKVSFPIYFGLDDKKLNFEIWIDKTSKIIVKVAYNRLGNWEYRMKKAN